MVVSTHDETCKKPISSLSHGQQDQHDRNPKRISRLAEQRNLLFLSACAPVKQNNDTGIVIKTEEGEKSQNKAMQEKEQSLKTNQPDKTLRRRKN